MKNKIIILAIFIVPLLLFAALNNFSKENAAGAAATQALNKGKLIKFSSPMCSECKKVKETIQNVLPEYNDLILIEDINVSDNTPKSQDMIETYKVSVVPTVIFIDKTGNIVNKIEGLVDEATLKENLEIIK